jgi:putative DNA primase/helicase
MSSIQILKYRETINTDTGKKKFVQTIVGTAPSIIELFKNIKHYVSQIAEGERYDIHYTLAHCLPESPQEGVPPRSFEHQEVLAFDIDGCDKTKEPMYTNILCSVLKVYPNQIGIACSGNGLHYIIQLDKKHWVYSQDKLEENKKYYKAICGEINLAIYTAGLSGSCDPVTYAVAKTLRLPNTTNPKPPATEAYVINSTLVPFDIDITKIVNIIEIKEDNETLYKIEPSAVLKGCKFLQHCNSYPAKVTEPEWFKMMSVLSLMQPMGETLCHEFSKGHPNYSHTETQRKYEQARSFGKPSTCESIHQVWGRCHECPHFGKIRTPLSIKSDEYIATEKDGFHKVIKKDGIPIKWIPIYHDLVKYYEKSNRYIVNKDSRILFHYCGTHWIEVNKLEIESFATQYFNPPATNSMRNEFYGLLTTRNLKDDSFFGTNTQGYINFKNGILDIASGALLPHSVDFGFRYCLPYEYNPHAKSPVFDRFLEQVSCGDKEIIRCLLEFMAYTLAGVPASVGQKCLILTGEGSNGKSVFLNLLQRMVGEDCFSSVSISTLSNPVSRYQLIGKLFNVAEEAPTNALTDSSDFKAITSGGTVEVKKLYHQPAHARIDCKLIFSCNSLPYNYDYSEGTFRRLLIIPFVASFTDEKGNKISGFEDYLYPEISGIYNRVIEAYNELKKNRFKLTVPNVTKILLEDYRTEDNVYEYFNERIEISDHPSIDPVWFISCRELQKDYNSWCFDRNTKAEPDVRFFRKINSYINKKVSGSKHTKRENGVQLRGFRFVRISKLAHISDTNKLAQASF